MAYTRSWTCTRRPEDRCVLVLSYIPTLIDWDVIIPTYFPNNRTRTGTATREFTSHFSGNIKSSKTERSDSGKPLLRGTKAIPGWLGTIRSTSPLTPSMYDYWLGTRGPRRPLGWLILITSCFWTVIRCAATFVLVRIAQLIRLYEQYSVSVSEPLSR